MSITEVSKRAGVSIATVSRVINKNLQVAPDTAAAVWRAIEELGYTPPPRHRRLRGRPRQGERTRGVVRQQVALLFPDNREECMRTPLSGRLMQALAQNLGPRHISFIPSILQPDGGVPLAILNREVDGVFVRGATDVSPVAGRLAHLPVVWLMTLTRMPEHGDQVADDTDAAGQLAASYLMRSGGGLFAVLYHEPEHASYKPRAMAFAEAVRAAGGRVEVLNDGSTESLARRLATMSPRPRGVFIPTPEKELLIAHRVLCEHGIVPGRDMEWVGCGYDPVNQSLFHPPLANIDIRAESIAHAAIDMLLWRLANPNEPQRRLTIAPTLVEPIRS